MTKSEIHALMTNGFATIAGTVLAAFISFGIDAGHLLTASIMSAPAALGFAKLFYPEEEVSMTNSELIEVKKGPEVNALHAACEGVSGSIKLVANIGANLIAFISFLAFVDSVMNWACVLIAVDDGVCIFSNLLGYVFMPLAWVIGVPYEDCYIVAQLIGTKVFINEFVAFQELGQYISENALKKRSEIIATYALCGFSNIATIGIQVGGLGSIAPEKRGVIAQVVVRAMISGTVACFLTACVAGTLISADENQAWNSTQISI